jgi:hypothetical protein
MVLRPIVSHLMRPITKLRLGELSGNDRTLRLGRQVVEERCVRSGVGYERAGVI